MITIFFNTEFTKEEATQSSQGKVSQPTHKMIHRSRGKLGTCPRNEAISNQRKMSLRVKFLPCLLQKFISRSLEDVLDTKIQRGRIFYSN